MTRHPLFLDGELPVSGEVQFWRMNPDTWEPALRAVKEIGISTIATYLSWRRHEPTPGSFNLTGVHGPELNVHRFLGLCRDIGLRVILKPGPWICAEEPGGGFPDWLLENDSIIALDWQGQPVSGYNPPFKHPMPSYASVTYRKHVSDWIRNVWSDLAEFTGANGPIVATQYDNEPSLGFQDTMYGFDHHPDALVSWREFAGPDAIPPQPRTTGPSAPSPVEITWAQWQRRYVDEYLEWLKATFERAGAGHLAGSINLNTHPVRGWPQDGSTIAETLTDTVVGEDHYFIPPLDEQDLTGLALAAAQVRTTSTPLRWAPEMQAGIWRSPGEPVDYPDPTVTEMIAWWTSALAFGYHGFNLYMLVNRENWEHAPIDNDGTITPLGHALKELLVTLRAVPDLSAFTTIADTKIKWDPADRISAYRIRGTQAAPSTAWDDPEARAGYDDDEYAARLAVTSGRQFDLSAHNALGGPPPIATSPGVLARVLHHPDGRRVVIIVRWKNDGEPATDVRVPIGLFDPEWNLSDAVTNVALAGRGNKRLVPLGKLGVAILLVT